MQENEYPVIVKTYDLTLWYSQRLSAIPRNYRFTLGQEIQNELISLLLRLTEAIYTKEKKALLKAKAYRFGTRFFHYVKNGEQLQTDRDTACTDGFYNTFGLKKYF